MKLKSVEFKLVICVSGGLDSIIAYHYAIKHEGYKQIDILPLFFDIGQPYVEKERNSLYWSKIPYKEIHLDLIREEFNNIPTPDFPNQIIPGRNLIFVTIAASFASRIWIVALDSEMHKYAKERDKSWKFYKNTSNVLTYIFNIKRPVTYIHTPFSNKTKTEIVKWALDNGLTKNYLKQTSSCYDDKYKNCGNCSTCFKRWVAFINNDIYEDYQLTPYYSNDAQELIKNYKKAWKMKNFSHYSKKRIIETFNALKKVGVIEWNN